GIEMDASRRRAPRGAALHPGSGIVDGFVAVAGFGGLSRAAGRVAAVRPLPARHDAAKNGGHPRGGNHGSAGMRLARPFRNLADPIRAGADLTRRRGDAEQDAEKYQGSQNLRTRRQRSQWAWRQRGRVPRSAPPPQVPLESNSCVTRPSADKPSDLACASLRSLGISADSASPRQEHGFPSGSSFAWAPEAR